MYQENRKYIGQACYICISSKAELVSADGNIHIPLSVTEYKVLSFFIDHANTPVYLEELALFIWGPNYDADHKDPESLKSHISRLRYKLEKIRNGLRNCLDTNYGLKSYTLKIDDSLFEINQDSYSFNDNLDNKNSYSVSSANSERLSLPHVVTKSSPFFADERDVIYRENDIAPLLKMLSKGKESILLSGFGGIGKTSVARVLYSKLAGKYDCIGWVEYIGDIKTSILTSFDICSNIQNQEYRWTVISRILKNSGQSILLFIDNVDSDCEKNQNPLSDHFLYEISGFPNLSIVLTSRLEEIRGYHTVQISGLSKDECEDLFYFYYNRNEYNCPHEYRTNRDAVCELVERAGYHTFAIELLAKCAKRFTDLDIFAQSISCVGFHFPSRRITTNYSEMELDAASQLRRVFNTLSRSKLERKILWDISILPNTIISFAEITEWLGYQDEEYEKLITDGWLSIKGGGIYMHPLVKEVIYFDLDKGKAPTGTAENLIRLINHDLFFSNDDSFKTLLRKFEIANSALLFINPEEIHIDALQKMGGIARQTGRITTALTYFRKVLGYYLSCKGDCDKHSIDVHIATAYNELGYQLSYTNSGRTEAEDLLRKALAIRESLYKQEPNLYAEQFATTCDYLGYLLSDNVHSIREGESLLRAALAIRKDLAEKYGGHFIHDAAWTEDNLGFLLSIMNAKHDEAEQHLREALSVRKRMESLHNGEFLTEVAWTCTNLAFLLQSKRNNLAEAENLYREANEALQKADSEIPGVHMADIAINNNNLAILIAMDPSRYSESEDLFLSALTSFRTLNRETLGLYSGEVVAIEENLNNLTTFHSDRAKSSDHIFEKQDKLRMNILSGARIIQTSCYVFINEA